MNLGDEIPNLNIKTTVGDMKFHEWQGNSWAILFSHPADFTPVCTTELAKVVKLYPEFIKRNVKPIALSCDSLTSHKKWIADIKFYAAYVSEDFPYPIISDEERDIACQLNMLDPDEKSKDGIPLTARAVFIIDDKKKMRLSMLYPANVGRNFDEVLRVIDALQLSDKHKIATPANWKNGDAVMIQPTVSEEEATKLFPVMTVVGLPSGKNYIRQTNII